MESVKVMGLVIKQTNYSESDKVLKIFTKELGIITVMAKGVRKYKSHQRAASSLFCYGEYTLFPGKNMYTMRGNKLINSFYSIGENVEKLALASYFCEITDFFVPDFEAEEEILSLLLNTLYILSEKERNLFLVKAVYELKFLSLSGYEIETDRCAVCGSENTLFFSPQKNGMLCPACADLYKNQPKSVGEAVKYILKNDTKLIFSFTLDETSLNILSSLSEKFILKISEKEFNTLAYFHGICV